MNRWYIPVVAALLVVRAVEYGAAAGAWLPPFLNVIWILAVAATIMRLHRYAVKRWARSHEWLAGMPSLEPLTRPLPVAVLAGALLLLQAGFIGTLMIVSEEFRAATLEGGGTARSRMLLIPYFLVLAPILEEICFRGWIQTAITSRFSHALGISGSAVLFTVMHRAIFSTPAGIPSLLAIGLLLGGVAAWTASLRSTIWLHVVLNAGALGIPAAMKSELLPAPAVPSQVAVWAALVTAGALATVAATTGMWRGRFVDLSRERHTGV